MRSRLRQWRTLLSVEAVLLLLVLVAAGAVLIQSQQRTGARRERAAIEGRVALVQESLAALLAGGSPATLGQQIQELQASVSGQTLPSRRDALAVSAVLTDYAAQGGLLVLAASTGEGTLPGAGKDETVPVMKVSLEVEGPLAKLIGLFGAMEGFPAARVQTLEFSPVSDGVWNAKLELTVAYGPDGQGAR